MAKHLQIFFMQLNIYSQGLKFLRKLSVENAVSPDNPVNKIVVFFIRSAVFWFLFSMLFGLMMSIFMHSPEIQESFPVVFQKYFSFGRIRPIHTNMMLFGWLSLIYVAAIFHITSKLTENPLWNPKLIKLFGLAWNVFLIFGTLSFFNGSNQGHEYAEFNQFLDFYLLGLFGTLLLILVQSHRQMKFERMYVSQWNFLVGITVLIPIYAIGNRVWSSHGAYVGTIDGVVNGFYIHNLFNAWFTTIGLGIAYYLLSRLTSKPLYSHQLAIWGIWSVWTGQHHHLWTPVPRWLEHLSVSFSFIAAISTTAFFINFSNMMRGAWSALKEDITLRFFVCGVIAWGLTCIQGLAQSIREFNFFIHFTNWIIGHSHLAFVASYSFWGFSFIYYFFSIKENQSRSTRKLAELHFWFTSIGLGLLMVSLWIAGLVQGFDWMASDIQFLTTVIKMKPYLIARSIGGGLFAIGQIFFLAYLIKATSFFKSSQRIRQV